MRKVLKLFTKFRAIIFDQVRQRVLMKQAKPKTLIFVKATPVLTASAALSRPPPYCRRILKTLGTILSNDRQPTQFDSGGMFFTRT